MAVCKKLYNKIPISGTKEDAILEVAKRKDFDVFFHKKRIFY